MLLDVGVGDPTSELGVLSDFVYAFGLGLPEFAGDEVLEGLPDSVELTNRLLPRIIHTLIFSTCLYPDLGLLQRLRLTLNPVPQTQVDQNIFMEEYGERHENIEYNISQYARLLQILIKYRYPQLILINRPLEHLRVEYDRPERQLNHVFEQDDALRVEKHDFPVGLTRAGVFQDGVHQDAEGVDAGDDGGVEDAGEDHDEVAEFVGV